MRKFDVNDFYELNHAFGADWEYNDQVRDPLAPGEIVLTPKPVAEEEADNEIDLSRFTGVLLHPFLRHGEKFFVVLIGR